MTNYSHGVKSLAEHIRRAARSKYVTERPNRTKEPQMKPLHRLPNGTWIDLASVDRISPYATHNKGSATVTIEQHDGRYLCVQFASNEEAIKFADGLADIVNAARSMEGMVAPKGVP